MNKISREQAKEAFQILLNLNHEMLEVSSAWETVGVFFSQTCEIEDNGYIFCPICGEKIDDTKA